MKKRLTIGIAVLTIIVSSFFLAYWLDPNRVIWAKDGKVTAVHEYSDSSSATNWNVLVFIFQQNDNGYLVNNGFVALNGQGTLGHGNFCWDNGHNDCLSTPLNFSLNQTLTVEALNNGEFMLKNS